MMIRLHRGSLSDSMATVDTIEPTKGAVAAWAALVLDRPCAPADIVIGASTYDVRCNWHTRTVSVRGVGVVGMCNEAVS